MPDASERVLDLAKRRGFLWPAFEAYGGLAGFYDYGPLGAAMKQRLEDLWRHVFVHTEPLPMAEIHCPRVTPHEVLKASGHVDQFTDVVVRCGNGHPSRADHLVQEAGYAGNAGTLAPADLDAQIAAVAAKCPQCGNAQFSKAARQNLMNATEIGPGSGRTGYLRPETAQGIFVDFPHLLRHVRGRLPFGAVQVGGSHRNEISPRQGMLRLREFHMMEAEVFFTDTSGPFPAFETIADTEALFLPNTQEEAQRATFRQAVARQWVANEALAYFLARTQRFLLLAGMDPSRLRLRQHLSNEMAHYAQDCWDAEFQSERYGWVECVGVADRGCYDLQQHAAATGRPQDFQVPVDLAKPIGLRLTRHEADMGRLGRLFKADAKVIAAALEARFAAALREALASAGLSRAWLDEAPILKAPETAQAANAPLAVTADGQTWHVPAEALRERSGTWTLTGVRLLPRVIEPSFGVDRILYALWEHGLEETHKEGEAYVRLRLSPHVAPIQVAVLPLMAKDGLDGRARAIEADLRAAGFRTDGDASGSIGRRYARQDEAGTPLCVTVDTETPRDHAVTLRDRDTTEQVRVPVANLVDEVRARFRLP